VLEAGSEAGGACRTITSGEFAFDLTGHLLHLARPESEELLAALAVRRRLRTHRRRAGIALAGSVTPYPIQIHTHRLPRAIRRECVLGFIQARMGECPIAAKPGSFAHWVLDRFGEGFARHFFFPYNRKLYLTDLEDVTSDWVGRYVPRPELSDVIEGAFGLYRQPVGYNASFFYPRSGGIRLLADTLACQVPDLRLDTPVRALHLKERVLVLDSGATVTWDTLIATAPLPALVKMTSDLPRSLGASAQALRAVAVVNLNFGVRGASPRREHWLYIPEERFAFYRVGIPSNHGRVAPAGCHTLSVETSVPAGEPSPPDLTDRCLAGLEELGLLRRRGDIEAFAAARLDPAYVVFNQRRPAVVAALRERFKAAGVLLAGRWAEWKYSTMEDALWDGATAAKRAAR
jgi:protoporphyrinogen oxidase